MIAMIVITTMISRSVKPDSRREISMCTSCVEWIITEGLPRPGRRALAARHRTQPIIPGVPGGETARCSRCFRARGPSPSACSPKLGAAEPVVRATFAEASDVLGYDLWALCQRGPEAELGATERTQPAMLAAGVATWRVWIAPRRAAARGMAGHSLGEYTALVCSGAIDFSGRRPRALPRPGDAAGRAAGRAPWRRSSGSTTRTRRRLRGGRAGRSGRAGEFQCARPDRHRRQAAAVRVRSRRPRRAAPSARCAAGQRAVAQQPDAGAAESARRAARRDRGAAAERSDTYAVRRASSTPSPTASAVAGSAVVKPGALGRHRAALRAAAAA